ncbi:hypothetical protein ACVWWJ_001576 [Luteibacter sp. HA06]|jgi:hypothetical protein
MKDKPGQKYRRKAYGYAFITGVAILGLFFQAWRVHAFDVQDAVRHMPHHAAHSKDAAPVPASTVTAAVATRMPVTASSAPQENRWSDGDVVSALSSFYQTIITFMGILIALMGGFSVLTLRFFSKAAAEDMAHEAAQKAMFHYLETNKFREDVTYAVQEIGLSGQMESVEKDLVEIKKLLKTKQPSSVDTSEDEEGTIGFPPDPGAT